MKKLRVHHIVTLGTYSIFKERKEEPIFENSMMKLGYSRKFSRKMMGIFDRILEREDIFLELTDGLDVVCEKCPYVRKICRTELTNYDVETAKSLELNLGSFYTSRQIKNISRNIGMCNSLYKSMKKDF